MNISKQYKLAAWCCFLITFTVYFLTVSPTVPPYRDAGELIVAANTLSVAHSPGYPLHMITGRIFIVIGGVFGINPALSMNLLASFSGAFAVFFLFLIIYKLSISNNSSNNNSSGDIFAAFYGSLLAGFSYINWYLAIVAQMYSLSLALVMAILYFVIEKKFLLAAFIAGLALGNHLTSLFAIIPFAIYIVLIGDMKKQKLKNFFFYFLLGISVYIYLPIRALGNAFINWGDPSNFERFIRVVSRAAYGHTLDLVSREVALYDVFTPYLIIFGKSILRDITVIGIILALVGITVGIYSGLRRKKYLTLMLMLSFILTGPFFIYLAGMPVNPHALAIVEVAYMIPVAILCLFAGLGLSFIIKKKILKYPVIVIAATVLIYNTVKIYQKVDMSENYFAADYALNILNSVSEDALVIMRRDHTMFALWYKRDVEGVRQDVAVISKGLLSAQWYREKLRLDHPKRKWKQDFISDTAYIKWLCERYPNVYLTAAAAGELAKEFFDKYSLKPFGLVFKVIEKDKEFCPTQILAKIESKYIFRGDYRTTQHYDFFSRDFITLYAQFYDRIGMEYMRQGNLKEARANFAKAIHLDATFSRPHANLAFSYFSEDAFQKAQSAYITAIALMEDKIDQHTRRQFFMRELAELHNNLGAVYEKLGNFSEALNNYNRALKADPTFSQAYYNKGVIYWRRNEWDRVVDNFRLALKYDPDNPQIKRFYEIAVRNLRQRKE